LGGHFKWPKALAAKRQNGVGGPYEEPEQIPRVGQTQNPAIKLKIGWISLNSAKEQPG
jgi:hypothetical protein